MNEIICQRVFITEWIFYVAAKAELKSSVFRLSRKKDTKQGKNSVSFARKINKKCHDPQ